MADKKKKAKGNGKKKKKTGENVYEGLLEYKITVIDKELEEWRFRMVALAEESETLAGRDAHLREECDTTMKSLVTKAVQYDKDNIDYPKVDKDDVYAALHEKMHAAAEEETQLREIHDQMFHVEIEIFKTRSRIKHWTKYRDVTREEEQRAIQSLERELAYMIDNHDVLSQYLERTTKEERSAMTQMAQDKIDQKTRAAIERVAMGLDRFTKKMLSENQYMHEEIHLQERALADIDEQVRALQQTNIAIHEKLNNAHVANTTAFTSTFLTDTFPDEITTHILNHSLLDVDLGQLTIRSDPGDRAYEEVLNKIALGLPAIEDENTIVSPMARLHIGGSRMRVQSPSPLNPDDGQERDSDGSSWIDTARLRDVLRKA